MDSKEIDKVREALESARTPMAGYVVHKKCDYPEVVNNLWKEIRRMDKCIIQALSALSALEEDLLRSEEQVRKQFANANIFKARAEKAEAALSTIDPEGKPDHWPSWKAKAEEMERNWLGATETHNQARKMYDEQNARMWAMARRPEAPEGFVQRMLHMSREDQDYILSMGIDKHLADPDAIRREVIAEINARMPSECPSIHGGEFHLGYNKALAHIAAILSAEPAQDDGKEINRD